MDRWDALPNTFTTATARARGIHPRDLYRWRDEGEVHELSRGVYRRSDAPPPSLPDLLAVSYRAPRAVICCVSAAFVYDLTDQIPIAVQIAILRGDHPPRISYPPVKVLSVVAEHFEPGLSMVEAAPEEWVRIYDPERTVVDLIRFRGRLGEPLAYGALHRLLERRSTRIAKLLDYATALGASGPVRNALDIVRAG